MLTVAALYHFTRFSDPAALRCWTCAWRKA
jgi:hypothetical protein